MVRPVILITPDVTLAQVVGVDRRVYQLYGEYADAVLQAGGLPWVSPYLEDEALVARCVAASDGVVLTGGDFDVDPRLYGQRPHPALGTLKPDRTAFEMAVLRAALAAHKPVLGICGGMQLIAVAHGGTLHQDLPSQQPAVQAHTQAFDRRQPSHSVLLESGSRVAQAFGATALEVNSTHHQAVCEPGTGIRITGRAADGVVEALEKEGPGFVVGVQWHPEVLMAREATPDPRGVYTALVAAAGRQEVPA